MVLLLQGKTVAGALCGGREFIYFSFLLLKATGPSVRPPRSIIPNSPGRSAYTPDGFLCVGSVCVCWFLFVFYLSASVTRHGMG